MLPGGGVAERAMGETPPAVCHREGCKRTALNSAGFCSKHDGLCVRRQCRGKTAKSRHHLCLEHGGGKPCLHPECDKKAKRGGTQHCKMHGGGARCASRGCDRLSRRGTAQCKRHVSAAGEKDDSPLPPAPRTLGSFTHESKVESIGLSLDSLLNGTAFCKPGSDGGLQCYKPGCSKRALSNFPYCKAHNPVRVCKRKGCSAPARRGTFRLCTKHGGGQCLEAGCNNPVVTGDTFRCQTHKHLGVTITKPEGLTCNHPDCPRPALKTGPQYCAKHGGGYRCASFECYEKIQQGTYCPQHAAMGPKRKSSRRLWLL